MKRIAVSSPMRVCPLIPVLSECRSVLEKKSGRLILIDRLTHLHDTQQQVSNVRYAFRLMDEMGISRKGIRSAGKQIQRRELPDSSASRFRKELKCTSLHVDVRGGNANFKAALDYFLISPARRGARAERLRAAYAA